MRALALLMVVSTGCATLPGQIDVLADADTPSARAEAAAEAVRWLEQSEKVALKMSAARVLGRLRYVDADVVSGLGRTLADRRADAQLRRMSAWALGELRDPASLAELRAGLRGQPDAALSAYLLEGLVMHSALMANDSAVLLAVVEDLVFFAGNRRSDAALPSTYRLLTEQTRTMGVNVKVLQRTVDRARDQKTGPGQVAAMYNAAFELLARLLDRRTEIAAGPAVWAPQIDAAVEVAQRAYAADDPRTQLMVVYLLGRLATEEEVARRAAPAVSRFRFDDRVDLRIRYLATWLLDRLQLSGLAPKTVLLREVLTGETHPVVLRLIADLGAASGLDAPQRWLDLAEGPQ